MVDIRDFFGNPQPQRKRQRAAATAAANNPVVIDSDEGDTVPAKKPKVTTPKKKKTTTTTTTTTTTKKKADDDDFVIDVDGEDDDDDFLKELDELDSQKKNKSSPVKAPVNPVKPVKPVKAEKPAEKPAKPVKKQAKPAAATSTSTSTSTTGDVFTLLAQIPDAELPEETNTDTPFNYHAFKAKQAADAPLEPNTNIEIPQGAPNCLTGLTIVFTGILPNLSRDVSENIAKQYGAKVTKSISSKTSIVVLGDDAGPSKVKKIKQFKIKAITEEGFFMLLKGMPADGGDGDLAKKEKLRREKEEQDALKEALRMQEEQERLENEREKERAKKSADGGGAGGAGDRHGDNNNQKVISDDDKLWTVKYAPTKIEQICGNKSSVLKLKTWLETWQDKFGNKAPKKGDTEFRAVLIHGPPGIGKTTAAHLVAKELGFDVIEKNASDVRSKKLLTSTIKNVLNNSSVVGYYSKNKSSKFVIIMDEVDGMSGGDRGGVGELASYCRKTQTPLILICNDKSLPKMRPFDRVTLDLPFRRPSAREMKSRLMTIALREKIKLDPNIIDQLVSATSNDIRQIINLLSTVSRTADSINGTNSGQISKEWQKNSTLKIFDIVPLLFSSRSHSIHTPLFKLFEYYFDDHAFVPPMIQENYINSSPANMNNPYSGKTHLEMVSNAADSISLGDLIDAKIHSSEQAWSLMPSHALISTIRPASFVAGGLRGRVNFASWFGQNSKMGKYYRILREVEYRMRLKTGGSGEGELRLFYVPLLIEKLLNPLLNCANDDEAIKEIVATLDYYYLTKTDWDSLLEFNVGPAKALDKLKKVPTKTKGKFTRVYNKGSHPVAILKPGKSTGVSGKAQQDRPDLEDAIEEDEEVESEEEDNDD